MIIVIYITCYHKGSEISVLSYDGVRAYKGKDYASATFEKHGIRKAMCPTSGTKKNITRFVNLINGHSIGCDNPDYIIVIIVIIIIVLEQCFNIININNMRCS
jgi:hypothetical protein